MKSFIIMATLPIPQFATGVPIDFRHDKVKAKCPLLKGQLIVKWDLPKENESNDSQSYLVMEEKDRPMQQHYKSITLVFDEAETKF